MIFKIFSRQPLKPGLNYFPRLKLHIGFPQYLQISSVNKLYLQVIVPLLAIQAFMTHSQLHIVWVNDRN